MNFKGVNVEFLVNARCKVSFDCGLSNTNAQNAFSVLVNGTFIPVKKKIKEYKKTNMKT